MNMKKIGIIVFAIFAGILLSGIESSARTFEVDQQALSASDANDGSNSKPFKTINAALKFAGAGDTVLVKPGVYREAVVIKRGGTQGRPVSIVSSEKHGAVISGADIVTEWTDNGGGIISFKLKGKPYVNPIVMGKTDGKRIPGNQPFVDKRPLVWVDWKQPLTPGTWSMNLETGEIFAAMPLGRSPEKCLIELSVRQSTLSAANNVDYVEIDGIHFTNAADYKDLPRSFQVSGKGWIVKNVLSDWNSLDGSFLYMPFQCRIENSVFNWNGMQGLCANAMVECVIKDSEFSFNNWRLCNISDIAGGIKSIYSLDNLLERNILDCNYGQGIWFDISCSGNLINGNVLQDTIRRGIFTETDWSQTIKGNIIARTWNDKWGASAGITIAESSCCMIENNLVFGCEDSGIQVRGDGHSRLAAQGGHARLVSDYADSAFMKDLSPQRRQRVVTEQKIFVNKTEKYRSAFNCFYRNIVMNCRYPYREEADYPLQPKQLGRCENLSDENIFVSASYPAVIRYFNGKSAGLEKWRELSGRDLKSLAFKDLPALEVLPDWAGNMIKASAAKIKTAKRPVSETRAFIKEIQDSPAAAMLFQRVSLADSVVPFPISHSKEISALKLKTGGRNCLVLWTALDETSAIIKLNVKGSKVLLETEWGEKGRPLESADGAVYVLVSNRPCYLWDIPDDAMEMENDLNISFEVHGDSALMRVSLGGQNGVNGKFEGRLILPDGIESATLKMELAPGADGTLSIPLRFKNGNLQEGIAKLIQIRGKIGGAELYASKLLKTTISPELILKSVPESIQLDITMKAWNAIAKDKQRLCDIASCDSKLWTGPEDLSFKAWGIHGGKSLLLCVEVKDNVILTEKSLDKLYNGDSVEFFIDGRPEEMQFQKDYSKGCYQIICAPGEKSGNAAVSNPHGLAGLEAFSARTAGGYRLMLRIPLDENNFPGTSLAGKRLIRLSISVNDKDEVVNEKKYQLRWGGTSDNWRSTSGWIPLTAN